MQVVIPVKSFRHAKKRLATLLSEEQRGDLMRHMLDDVLKAVAATPQAEAMMVVSGDAEVAQWVARRALCFATPLRIFDPRYQQLDNTAGEAAGLCFSKPLPEAGLCHAYSAAAAELSDRNVDTMLLLPADIPLVTRADIEALLAGHSCPGVSVAAAGSDGGTNALLVSAPDIIAPAFGEDSCRRHMALAREQGVEPVLHTSPGFSLDVDTSEDIRALLASGRECETLRYLFNSGIAAELAESESSAHFPATEFQQKSLQNLTNRQAG